MRKIHLRAALVVAASCILLLAATGTSRATLVSTVVPCAECTGNAVTGSGASPGATITVRDGTGALVGTDVANAGGRYRIGVPAATPGPLSITSNVPGDPILKIPPVIQPLLGTTSSTQHMVLPGSMASIGGNVFSLSGGFSAIDTSVDYNPASPTYGNLTGSILKSKFRINGIGPAGKLVLSLTSDGTYLINLASVWADLGQPTQTVAVDVPISGLATLNGLSTPFSGVGMGTVTFSDPLHESVDLTFALDSSDGPISGSLQSAGTSSCPEPSTFACLTVGFFAVGAFRLASAPKSRSGGCILRRRSAFA